MTDSDNPTPELSLEHRILIQLRQVLARVVRDLTPPPGAPYPLPPDTVDEIRACFALIAARERELDADRSAMDVPVFGDDAGATRIVELDRDRSDGEAQG